jgi:hypothetical protein
MYREVVGSIEVFDAPDGSSPIGTARCIGWDPAGSAVWRLAIPDEDLEGPCVIVDREFLSTRPDWHDLYRGDVHPGIDRPRRASRRPGGRPGGSRRAQGGVQPSIL